MLAAVKRYAIFAFAGGLCGALVASLVAPRLITWYVTPGGPSQALCNCPELAHLVVTELLQAQGIGAGVGALLAIVLAAVLGRRRDRSGAPPPTAP
ncbi:MAG: hypothetical protein HY903_04360 [Deltaproteobacteria bacterium]|nr:hypothetical protein [Deltaproteobacteria bacterium]